MVAGMQAAQQAAGNLSLMMGGITAISGIMGTTMDDSGNKTMQGMKKAMSGVTAFIGLMPMLQQANKAGANSFATLATSATMAIGAFMIVENLLSGLPAEIKPVVGAIGTLVAVIGAATVAWLAFHGTMTWGAAIPIILSAVGAGIASIKAMLPDAAAKGAGGVSGGGAAIPSSSQQNTFSHNININFTASGDTPIARENAQMIGNEILNRVNIDFLNEGLGGIVR